MAIFKNLNDLRTYMSALKEIDNAKKIGYSLEIKKYHPVQTDQQKKYLNFMISYLSLKLGQTFFTTLHDIQLHVCPVIFYTGEKDEKGNHKFKPLCFLTTAEASSVIRNVLDWASMQEVMIPEPTDKAGVDYCMRELESSGAGWV